MNCILIIHERCINNYQTIFLIVSFDSFFNKNIFSHFSAINFLLKKLGLLDRAEIAAAIFHSFLFLTSNHYRILARNYNNSKNRASFKSHYSIVNFIVNLAPFFSSPTCRARRQNVSPLSRLEIYSFSLHSIFCRQYSSELGG